MLSIRPDSSPKSPRKRRKWQENRPIPRRNRTYMSNGPPPITATARKWWQQHFLAVVVGIAVVVMLSFSTFLAWYIWRRRQQEFGRYKPVDAVAGEQELQQL